MRERGVPTGAGEIAVAATRDGGFVAMVLTWHGVGDPDELPGNESVVFAQIFDAAGNPVGEQIVAGPTSHTSEEQFPTLTALDNGGFVLFWDNPPSGSYFRIFSADGTPSTEMLPCGVAEGAASGAEVEAVALPGGGFALAYSDTINGSGQVFVEIRAADGELIQTLSGTPNLPSMVSADHVALLLADDGRLLVTWSQLNNSLESPEPHRGVFGRYFDLVGTEWVQEELTDGTPQTVRLIEGYEPDPLRMVALGDGRVLITITMGNRDASEVMARILRADGTPDGDWFQVNQTTSGNQQYANVTALSGGGFFIAWGGPVRLEDGSYEGGSWGRFFDEHGQPVSDEFVISIGRIGARENPFVQSVFELADGTVGLIVAETETDTGYFEVPRYYVIDANVFINEIRYASAGADFDEGFEIAGRAGLDLTGWSLVVYDAVGNAVRTIELSGRIPDQDDSHGALAFAAEGLGDAAGGIALVSNRGGVVQFLSWGGSVTAIDGPATGRTSTDIGVAESDATAPGTSLHLSGTGIRAGDFEWVSGPASFGGVNDGQDFRENDDPVAGDDEVRTDPGASVRIDVLANDSDTGNIPLTIDRVGPAANGTVTIVGDQIRYTPAANFSGVDSFT